MLNPKIRSLLLFICLPYLFIFNMAVSKESHSSEKRGSYSVNADEEIVENVI